MLVNQGTFFFGDVISPKPHYNLLCLFEGATTLSGSKAAMPCTMFIQIDILFVLAMYERLFVSYVNTERVD